MKKLLELENLIFSGEGISKLEQTLEYINELVTESGYQAEWIAVVRPPYRFCAQVWQMIKEGAEYFTLKLQLLAPHVVTTMVKKLKAINGVSIKFIPFNQLKKPGSNIYREFASLVSIKNLGELIEPKVNANDSIGNLQTRVQNICNKENLKFHQEIRNPNYIDIQKILNDSRDAPHILSNDKKKLISRINADKSKFLLTQEEFSKIENGIKENNHKLSNLLGPEFCGSEFKFSERLDL